jgi:predicted RNA binding protein YcfA (HicA-like mRNA interferase family)
MPKFPVDEAKSKVIKVLEHFGFVIVREREHIAMSRTNMEFKNI